MAKPYLEPGSPDNQSGAYAEGAAPTRSSVSVPSKAPAQSGAALACLPPSPRSLRPLPVWRPQLSAEHSSPPLLSAALGRPNGEDLRSLSSNPQVVYMTFGGSADTPRPIVTPSVFWWS